MFKLKPLKPVLLAFGLKLFYSLVAIARCALKPFSGLKGIAIGTSKMPRVLVGIALVVLIASVTSTTYLLSTQPTSVAAATASTINFQARLETATGAIVPDGYYNVEFKLYDAATSGTNLWTETRSYNSSGTCGGPIGAADCRVRVANGYLTVNLGSVTAFGSINWSQQLYLTMNIGGTTSSGPITWDGEMSPRVQLTAVPYAFQANSATQLQATVASNVGQLTFDTTMTGGNQTFILPDQGTTGNYHLLTQEKANTGYVQLQGSTPGTAQTGNFNIAGGGVGTGVGIANVLQAGTFDTPSGTTTLHVGTNNATSGISLEQNVTVSSGKTLTTQGNTFVETASQTAFQVQNGSSVNLFTVDTSNSAIVLGNDGSPSALTVRGGAASTSNTAGGNITFDASNGTGAAGSGDFIFRTAGPAAGSTVTFDNSWSTNDGASGAQHTFNWNTGTPPAIASGHSNYLLVVGVTITHNASQTVQSVTYNGASMSPLAAVNCPGTTCRNELWYLVNPTHDGASHAVLVTLSGAQTANYSIGAASYYNVDQTTPLQTAVTNSNTAGSGGAATFTSDSISTTTSQIALDLLATDQPVTNPGTQTVLWNNTSIDTAAAGAKPGTGGTVSFSWTSNSAHWADIMTAINPVANAAPDTLTDRLHITAAGNVGISTASPQYTLDVTGTGNFSTAVQTPQLQSAAATNLTLAAGSNLVVTTNGVTRATFDTSNHLYLGNGTTAASPNNFVIQGTGSSTTGVAGGSLTIQGGNATVGNANGGNLTLSGGTGFGTGVNGLVVLATPSFQTASAQSCAINCNVNQTDVDSNASVVINATASGLTITLPSPTITTPGKIMYVTAANASNDFTLSASGNTVTMHQNTTATMIWNGSAWTAAGASNATTLQATYNNGTNPSTVPEIKLDSTHGTIDIQNDDSNTSQDLFTIRAGLAGNLGTVLFGVSSTGRVTVQNVSDPSSAFRILDANGNYLYNDNANSGYTTDNNTRPIGNGIQNPSFESGGNITGGEEGWIGSSQASIVNSSSSAHTGNYELQVAANGSNQAIYNGSYYQVEPGDVIYFEGWVEKSVTTNVGATAGVGIETYDKDKNLVSASAATDITAPTSSYVLHKVTYTIPSSGVQYIRVAAKTAGATSGTIYFDDFYMSTSQRGPGLFQNSADSTTAFQIQSAAAARTLFTANTSGNIIKIGDSTGSNNPTIFQVDSSTANPSSGLGSLNGGLWYNSSTNQLEAVIGGAVHDICVSSTSCTGYAASASATIQLQTAGTEPGTQQSGFFNITGAGYMTSVLTMNTTAGSTNTSGLTIKTGSASGASSNSGSITIDTGTAGAGGTVGSIQIGHSGVTTTMPGNLIIQGSNTLTLGTAGSALGSIKLYSSSNTNGGHYVSLQANGADPTNNWNLVLPQNPGNSGDCLKDSSGTGTLAFSNCTAGATTTLQDTYNNSSSPATITLADGKNIQIVAQDTTTDPSIIFNLQCATGCGANGVFTVQNAGTAVFTVNPNSGGIVLGAYTQVGSSTTDTTQVNLQLDSYSTFSDSGSCTTTTNQGAMYYNSNSQSIRACDGGGADSTWKDVLTLRDMDLLMFGVVPDSGASNQGDIQSLITPGVSGPCKVSFVDNTHIAIQACVAYSGGRRVVVNAVASMQITGMTTTNIWESLCLTGTDNQPALSTAGATETTAAIYPTFSVTAPILCLAQIRGSVSTANRISQIFDTRAFSGTQKIPMAASTALSLSMVADMTSGQATPTVNNSKAIIGVVNATDGSTSSGTPNVIITTFGPSEAKAISGTNNSGDFVIQSGNAGYVTTHNGIPNNSFNYEMGIPGNAFSSTCTAASNCVGSLFVNFEVR